MTLPVVPPAVVGVATAPDPDLPSHLFDPIAYAFSLSLTPFKEGQDTLAQNVYGNAVVAYNFATTATAKAAEASGSADAAATSSTLAQSWATSLAVVSGGLYGARYYAQQAANAVAALPSGTINDTTPSGTSTFSSTKINTLLDLLAPKNAPTLTNPVLSLGGSTGNAGQVLLAQGSGAAPVWGDAGGANVAYETRSNNVALAPADKGKLIDLTGGGWTQTLQAAATLGLGWYCYLRYVDGNLPDTWNGTFTTDTLWTKIGSGWTISGGKANAAGTTSGATLTSTASPLIVGRRYRFTVTVTSTGGSLYLYAGTTYSQNFSTSGTYVFELACTGNTSLYFWSTSFTGTVDDLKIVDLGGVSIDPNASELIDGVTIGNLKIGQTIMIVCTGVGFVCQALHTNTVTEFLSSGTSWVCPLGVRSLEATLVGGGNGAVDAYREGAGGSTTLTRHSVHPSRTYTYAVGAGGTYAGGTGGTTSLVENGATIQASNTIPINGYFTAGYRTYEASGYSSGGPSFGGFMGYGRGGSPGSPGSAGGIILRY